MTLRETMMSSAAWGQPRRPSRVDITPSFMAAPWVMASSWQWSMIGQVEHLRVLDGAAHELVVLHAMAVVGDGDDAGALERAGGRELLALLPDGDAAGRIDVDDGAAFDGVVDVLDGAGVVGDRAGVRHADDGGESAGGGGPRAGLDGLLVRLAGLAQVHVDVDQAGAGDEAAGVDLLRRLLLRGGEAGHEPAVGDEEIAPGVAPGGGVDDAGVGDPEEGHGHGPTMTVGQPLVSTASGWPPAQR